MYVIHTYLCIYEYKYYIYSYDLADPDELYDYVDDFKITAAENILKVEILKERKKSLFQSLFKM